MTIAETLKKERLAQHKTQAQWIKKINMSVLHYSEIESRYQRNGKHSDIDSEDLIRLLKANNISLSYFFDLVESSYVVDDKVEKIEFLSKELYKAFNENNYKRAKEIRDQVQELPYVPKSLYYSAILISLSIIGYSVGGIRYVIYIFIMIMIIHAIEAYVLNPKFMASKTELPIFYTFLVLLVAEHFWGTWGLIVGVPIFTFLLDILGIKSAKKSKKKASE